MKMHWNLHCHPSQITFISMDTILAFLKVKNIPLNETMSGKTRVHELVFLYSSGTGTLSSMTKPLRICANHTIYPKRTNHAKVGSIYWGKIAQGPIQMLPIWDITLVLTCKHTKGHGIWKHFDFPMLNPHWQTC